MPYVRVHIDADDALEELSDDELREELASRGRTKGSPYDADHRIPAGVASDALVDASDILRKAGHTALAFKLDETRYDYVEPREPVHRFNRFVTKPSKLATN